MKNETPAPPLGLALSDQLAVDEEATKICKTCGVALPLKCFRRGREYSMGRRTECKQCEKPKWEAYNKSEAARAACSRWRQTHEPVRAPMAPGLAAEQAKKKRDRLSIGYVKQKLAEQFGIPYFTVPLELVDMKREQLELRRLARQLKKGIEL